MGEFRVVTKSDGCRFGELDAKDVQMQRVWCRKDGDEIGHSQS